MTLTHNNNNNNDYIVTNDDELNNLPIDITTLIIRYAPKQDLTNLPTTLKYVFFRDNDIFFDEYENDDKDENNVDYYMNKNNVEYDNIYDSKIHDGLYFNHVQPYQYYNTTPTCGIDVYSFSLYEPIIKTFKIKIPFDCKLYNCENLVVIANGYFNVNTYNK